MNDNAFSPLSGRDPDLMRTFYGIDDEDLELVKEAGTLVGPSIPTIVEEFYTWVIKLPEYDEFFSDEVRLERVQQSQVRHWRSFFEGKVDHDYIRSRRALGQAHARIGLSLQVYLAGVNRFVLMMTESLRTRKVSVTRRASMERSVTLLMILDTALVVDEYHRAHTAAMTAQSRMLMEVSTPVTQVWEGILMLPVVGMIDSKRAHDILAATLTRISETGARVFILDISGVAVVDTAVANHLIMITQATRLMGCQSTISGISPSIAQTMVELGIEVGTIRTTAVLSDAIAAAFDQLGITLLSRAEA